MTEWINYSLPMLGLLLSVVVVFMRKINTKNPICIARMCLWMVLWLFWLWADWGSSFEPNFLSVMARFTALLLNLLAVKALTKPRSIKNKVLITKVEL